MSVIQRLKNFSDTMSTLDEMVELEVQAKALRDGYEARNLSVPEALSDGMNRVHKAIDLAQRDDLEKRLREARVRRAALMTPDEKRRTMDEEIAKLEQALGVDRPAPATAS